MSAATGLGLVEVSILDACDRNGAHPRAPHQRTARILNSLDEATGIGPRVAYQVLCDMARPDISHLALIDFNGNYGSSDYGAASARYTEARLTPLGAAALAAERDQLGALPIGLINGNTHVDGPRPPLDPHRLLAAVRAAAIGSNDDMLAELVGLPVFPTGCAVAGDQLAFASGAVTELELAARISPGERGRLVISHLPPDVGSSVVLESIMRFDAFDDRSPRSSRPSRNRRMSMITEVDDESSPAMGTRIVVTLRADADEGEAISDLAAAWGVCRTMSVCLGRPVGRLLRDWIAVQGRTDLEARLALIDAAIADQAGRR
jgi:DNA gyrase/topoisomerase IV subunit A